MSAAGRYFDNMRAVVAVSVNTAMARIFKSCAACAIDSQIVSATDRCAASRWPGVSGWSAFASVSATIRAIISTASSGYLPLAVSPDSMTASVPSNTALATSLASARVGRGFSVIDSSICVAVMTGRRKSSARRITYF